MFTINDVYEFSLVAFVLGSAVAVLFFLFREDRLEDSLRSQLHLAQAELKNLRKRRDSKGRFIKG